eukprot:TRINITY_DN16112_c0_g1_i1.p1 TRINITY_DN16112_c0_g1~~TRINITY_DN16112_c0_g1_i1.p1  ORF type:complete len:225 (+),score=15.01 TRINITY_DN16112_c0_g1_i1:377-1051(+)
MHVFISNCFIFGLDPQFVIGGAYINMTSVAIHISNTYWYYISNCYARHIGTGILIGDTSAAKTTPNMDVTIVGFMTTTVNQAIAIWDSIATMITNCYFGGSIKEAIYVAPGVYPHVTISSNYIHLGGWALCLNPLSSCNGVTLNAGFITINYNVFTYNHGRALYILPGVDSVVAEGNIFRGNAYSANITSGYVVFSNNICRADTNLAVISNSASGTATFNQGCL